MGSISGTVVTIYANNLSNNCGSSVLFDNSGDISTFNVTDSGGNTFVGENCGHTENDGTLSVGFGKDALSSFSFDERHTAVGWAALTSVNGQAADTAVGYNSLSSLTGGSHNTALGDVTGVNLVTGSYNLFLGTSAGSAYTSGESSNVLIAHPGVISESNVMRIGATGSGNAQVSSTYLAGVNGVTVSNPLPMVISSSTEQVGTGTFSVNVQIFTISGTYTPSAGLYVAMIEVVGGGGAGGGAAGAPGIVTCGAGGGGGGYFRVWVSAATIGGSQIVTVGTGGVGSPGLVGGNGGDSSVGILAVGEGGDGGAADASGRPFVTGGAGGGYSGASGGFGTLGGNGGYSGPNFGAVIQPYSFCGYGGGGFFAQPTPFFSWCTGSANFASGGVDGETWGQGGSGGINANFSMTNQAGGAGFEGIVIITEYLLN